MTWNYYASYTYDALRGRYMERWGNTGRKFFDSYPRKTTDLKYGWRDNIWDKYGMRVGVTHDYNVSVKDIKEHTVETSHNDYDYAKPLVGYADILCIATKK